MFFKTRYYPVDIDAKIIYNDPKRRDCDASDYSTNPQYNGKNTIGIKGARLNEFNCYRSFAIVDPCLESHDHH